LAQGPTYTNPVKIEMNGGWILTPFVFRASTLIPARHPKKTKTHEK
jgi:hypothetical protein